MRLQQINENLAMQQMRAALRHSTTPEIGGPAPQFDHLYNAPSGHDSGSRVAGGTFLPTGVPKNPRHRRFMGMENRPGAIRL